MDSDHLIQELERLKAENRALQRQILADQNACPEYGSDSALFRSGPMILFKLRNCAGWPVQYVSPNVQELLGHAQEYFLQGGVGYSSLIHPEDLARFSSEIETHLSAACNAFTHAPHRILDKSGNIHWVLARTAFIRDANGAVQRLVGYILDISERRRTEAALCDSETNLRHTQARLALAHQLAKLGSWSWNKQTGEIFWSDEIYRIYERDKALGPPSYEEFLSLQEEQEREAIKTSIARAFAEDGAYSIDHRIVLPSGATKHIRALGQPDKDAQGRSMGLFGTVQDITGITKAQRQLELLASADNLTGILNRGRFMELASLELERQKRYSHPISLIMFDADHFHFVNDTYGHQAGDAVLKAIAKTIRTRLRDIDLLGRVGGEEFAIALPETRLRSAKRVAERLRSLIAAQRIPLDDGEAVSITVSLGVTELVERNQTLHQMLTAAVDALHLAKCKGRNRVECA